MSIVMSTLQATAPVALNRLPELERAAHATSDLKNELLLSAATAANAVSTILFKAYRRPPDDSSNSALAKLPAKKPDSLPAAAVTALGAGGTAEITERLQNSTAPGSDRQCVKTSPGPA
ncbi:uncharacterized protein TEOVI_000217000 [Trypanosoma equiperdum]|uniref:Uncharacterized protein n=1 Tax=Trypanosoma equiperdum TaxID=5694 RepID=A0A1G4IDX1_TRYEQ|nr:hypothetical protein TEOVI_000217000 [Trypanosoma equiperdum]